MLIPINLFLVLTGWREGLGGFALDQEAVEGGESIHTQTESPCLTDCARPGLLFTLNRCGLPLVFLRNYPSLSESMCQSNSLRVRAGPLPGHRESNGGRETHSLISIISLKHIVISDSITRLKACLAMV